MSDILILHGHSEYEIRKACTISRYLESKKAHKFPPLAELSLVLDDTFVNYSSFLDGQPGKLTLRDTVPSNHGGKNIALFGYLQAMVQCHDKVIILPSNQMLSAHSFVLTIGYAIGLNKVIGSLCHGIAYLPQWYCDSIKTVSSSEELLKLIK